jgi:uncharacterized protein YlaI
LQARTPGTLTVAESVAFARLGGPREGHSSMLHYTCDQCGKELHSTEDQRYVVKVEAFAAHDPAEITDADLDEDHMEAVSQLLQDEEENLDDVLIAPNKNFRFDLCAECHKRFLRDPLGREHSQKFHFSKN